MLSLHDSFLTYAIHYHGNQMNTLKCYKEYVLQLTDIDQKLISEQAAVFDLAKPAVRKRVDCRNAAMRSSATFLGTSYCQLVVQFFCMTRTLSKHYVT